MPIFKRRPARFLFVLALLAAFLAPGFVLAASTGGLDTPGSVDILPFSVQGSEIMDLKPNGLGIGTLNPESNLDVAGGGVAIRNTSYTSTGNALELNYLTGVGMGQVAAVAGASRAVVPLGLWGDPIMFYGSSGTGAPLMSIAANGSVTIGGSLCLGGVCKSAWPGHNVVTTATAGVGQTIALLAATDGFCMLTGIKTNNSCASCALVNADNLDGDVVVLGGTWYLRNMSAFSKGQTLTATCIN